MFFEYDEFKCDDKHIKNTEKQTKVCFTVYIHRKVVEIKYKVISQVYVTLVGLGQ